MGVELFLFLIGKDTCKEAWHIVKILVQGILRMREREKERMPTKTTEGKWNESGTEAAKV